MKKYLDINVYEAAKMRVEYLFDEFENIYCSFSGGKDSSVCMHLMCEEAKKRNRKIGVLFIDTEAQYEFTIEHVEKMFKKYERYIDKYWVCLPMETDNNLSFSEQLWSWWDPDKKDLWVRDMPKDVINLDNNPIDYYDYKMTFEEFVAKFGNWYGNDEKTACVIGIRTQESLNRWRAIKGDKGMYKDKRYTTKINENVYNFYPIYDWETADIWKFYGKTGLEYNEYYDLMYLAGASIHQMRIDEPFGDEAKAGLNMFRVLEPKTWSKVVMRVNGANLGSIYSGTEIMGKNYKLPEGHTWKSFTEFLLDTLPIDAANHYRGKFDTFIKWWIEKGSGMPKDQIKILEEKYSEKIVNTHELSTRGKKDKEVIRFLEVVDEIPELDTKVDVLTWKRMAMCIIKNDYWCKSLNFGLNKMQQQKKKDAMEKYKTIL